MRYPVLFLLLFLFSTPCLAEDFEAETEFSIDAKHNYALISWDVPAGYHAYSHEQDSGGMPTNLKFVVEGIGKMPVLYPAGVPEPDPFQAGKTISAYNGRVNLLAILPRSANGKDYSWTLDLLLCSRQRCVPIKKSFSGQIPLEPVPFENAAWNIPELREELDNFSSTLVLESGAPPPAVTDTGTESGSLTEEAGPQSMPDPQLTPPEDFDLELKPVFFSSEFEVYSLWKALALGILAGLILNVMPCVLPVLALKINSILLSGNIDNKEVLSSFRKQNISFIIGVMCFFTLLAILLGTADLLWGQIFQSQTLVLSILFLVFLLGLSMLGVFTLPMLDVRFATGRGNLLIQSFFSGFLCTLLATPCSGPLLGGVLAWAFTQPLICLLAVFWAIGIGMSLPYLCFCIWPAFGRILPRPGNWMYAFEHILGFLLLGATLYLLTILPQNKYLQILIALLALAFCAWFWGRFCGLSAPAWKRHFGALFCIAVAIGSIFWISRPMPPQADWQPFDANIFTANHGEKNMLVEFTADWCPNCKYLESTVLTRPLLTDLQKKYNLELIKVDITQPNPYAEKLLTMLGSKSIPVTAIFPSGEVAGRPVVLRDIYGANTLKEVLKQIF